MEQIICSRESDLPPLRKDNVCDRAFRGGDKLDPVVVGVLGLVLLLVLLSAGIHIAFALGISAFFGFWFLLPPNAALSALWVTPWGFAASHALSVVILFVLTGYLAFASGITAKAYDVGYKLFGRLPGGLALATVYGSAAFAATTGSSVATVGTIGRVAIPEMERYGYEKGLAAGCVAAAGTLGTLIPPSVLLVLYGIIAEASIGQLLIAGIIPGIFSAILYGIMITVRVMLNPSLAPPAPPTPWKDAIRSLPDMSGVLILFLTMIGGIFLGIFTPTEAGAVGVLIASIGVVYRFYRHRLFAVVRQLGIPVVVPAEATYLPGETVSGAEPRMRMAFQHALQDTTRVVGMILAILIGAALFSQFVSLSRIPYHFSQMISTLDQPPAVILTLVLFLYIPLGMFLYPLSVMIIAVPITLPVILELGHSPIWYGIIVIKMMEVAAITPPVGLNVYVAKAVAPHIPLETIFGGIFWFFIVDLITIALLVIFPDIILFLPNLMF
jgi:TRAP-type C4-dicarboxylate transport system permease large subunit